MPQQSEFAQLESLATLKERILENTEKGGDWDHFELQLFQYGVSMKCIDWLIFCCTRYYKTKTSKQRKMTAIKAGEMFDLLTESLKQEKGDALLEPFYLFHTDPINRFFIEDKIKEAAK